jgi:hypothetical protein
VINAHNGIFQVPFLKFIAALVFKHVSKSLGELKDEGETRLGGGGWRPPLHVKKVTRSNAREQTSTRGVVASS